MKQITGEELKQIQLNILKEIHAFCVENNLTYYLAYGTLLGAVRHKGFIPWDDDIDIQMPRDDYNTLVAYFNSRRENQAYELIAPGDPRSRHSFVKIIDNRTIKVENGVFYKHEPLGVDIDVFPLDGEPEEDSIFEKWYSRLQRVYRLYAFNMLKAEGSWKRRVAIPLIRVFANWKAMKKIAEKLHKKYPYNQSEFVGAVESCFNFKGNRVKKACYEKTILMEFESELFYAPVGYDTILKKMYGDYMRLPPIEKQITHHSNENFWKEL